MSLEPEPNDDRALMLATFAASGDEKGVQRVLASDPGAVNELGIDGTSPICAAALWGHAGILRLLLDAMASPDLRNESGPRWTALHAAALQEEGKACMLLLNFKANPHERDIEGVAPVDYASVSEAVWPLFGARGCQRVSKGDLVEKGVLRRASSALEQQLEAEAKGGQASRRGIISEYSRPGSSYVVSREFPPRPGSSAAMSRRPSSTSRLSESANKNSRPIDILEEEESAGVQSCRSGLSGLGI
eukprot:TRINITY_DN54838_c0_g1_i1.p1 TRINITY_DN54838_c0_g1~~TRINITY_DN54838_c0_g1_i1.p1  ORF type:complete len:246 (+),score=46.32 TRINITY_DN54838_c0_g1_i1:91-828(+)